MMVRITSPRHRSKPNLKVELRGAKHTHIERFGIGIGADELNEREGRGNSKQHQENGASSPAKV